MITSCRFCGNYTGWLCDRESNSRSLYDAVLVFQCLSSNVPTYLADNCQLIADMRRLLDRHVDVCCSTVTQHLWWLVFRNSWTMPVKFITF